MTQKALESNQEDFYDWRIYHTPREYISSRYALLHTFFHSLILLLWCKRSTKLVFKTDTYKRAWPCLHITIPCIIFFGVPHLYFSSCNVLIHNVSVMYISDTASCLTWLATHELYVFSYIHHQTVLISIWIGLDATLTLIQVGFSHLNVFHPRLLSILTLGEG